MKQNQKGEAMIAVMVVILVVMWLSNGHMGMMGHSVTHAEKSGKAESHQPSVSKEPSEHQR